MKKKVFIFTLFVMLIFTFFNLPHTQAATSREVVCAYMEHMSGIKWTPSKTFAYYNDISKFFRTGKTYVGIPYTANNVKNLKAFRKNLKSAENGVPIYTGPTENYIGTNNAGAVLSAWSEISKTVKFTDESNMFPLSGTGTVTVGDYNYKVSKTSTEYIINASGDDVMLEAYSALEAGDAVFTYIPDVAASTRFITQVNTIKNSSGKINGEKSTVIVTEQTGFESMASNTTWSVGKRYTFLELLADGYIPITCSELKSNDTKIEAPVIYVEDFEGGKNVSISCGSADTDIYYTTDGTTPSRNSTKYSGRITLTASAVINAVAISNLNKSRITKRTVTVNESSAPQITVADSEAGKTVTASTDESDSVIYYSTDGYAFEKYTAPFSVSKSSALSFYAVKFGCRRSKTVQNKITLKTVEPPTVLSEQSTVGGKKLTFNCATSGVKFYYTVDGSEPDENSKSFYISIVIASSCNLKVRAMRSGMGASKSVSFNITLPAVQQPEITAFDVIGGKKITLSCATEKVKMYYTLNGTQPKVTDTPYTAPFYIKKNTNLRILAVKDGYEAAYSDKKLSVPTVSVPIIKVNDNLKVTISCRTSGALIYYTLDGEKPNMLSYLYNGAFKVKKGTHIRVYAIRNGMNSSDEVNVKVNSAMTTESTMVLSDYNYPTVLDYGQGYSIKGTVKSNYKITSVTAAVYSAQGRKISEVTEYPNIKSIDISKLNGGIDFSAAAAGLNYYKITAEDMQGQKVLLNKSFTVNSPDSRLSALSADELIYPSSLLVTQDFSIYGKIASNYIINNVTVGIFAVNGRLLESFNCKPMSGVFNVGVTDKSLNFSKLKAGTYYLKIIAEDEAAKKTLLNKSFNVIQPAENKGITVTGTAFPDIINQGSGFNIQGKVSSSSVIKTLRAEITLNDSKVLHSKTVNVNDTQYDIAMLSDYMFLDRLENGIYKLKITSCDSRRHETVLTSKEFIVTSSDSGKVMSIPDMYSYNYRTYSQRIDNKDYTVANCGSSFVCIAAVKSYLDGGKYTSPEDIFKAACDGDIFMGGVPSERQLLKLCKSLGMNVSLSNKIGDIKQSIESGKPIIVKLKSGKLSAKSEYVTVKGYSLSENGEYVYINSPSSPILSKKAIPFDDFTAALENGIFAIFG